MKAKYIVIGLVVVLVLGGAAFVAARLLQKPAQSRSGIESVVSASGDSVFTNVEMEMESAPELPDTPSEASGILTRVEDNSLFITLFEGNTLTAVSSSDSDEIIIPTPEGGGVEVEIVVTKDTQIYRDVTEFPSFSSGEKTPGVLQQKVEPITPNDIGKQGGVVVWGQRRGDRIIADVVVYHGF